MRVAPKIRTLHKNVSQHRNYATKVSHFIGEKSKSSLSPELENAKLFGEILDHQVNDPTKKYKDLFFSYSQERRWTYTDFMKNVNATAIGLLESGRLLSKSDTFAVSLLDDLENLAVKFATLKTPAVFASIPPQTDDATYEQYLTTIQPKSLLAPSMVDSKDNLDSLYDIIPELKFLLRGEVLRARKFPKLKSAILGQLKQERGFIPLPSILVYDPFPSPLPKVQSTLDSNDFAQLYFVHNNNQSSFEVVGFSQKGIIESAKVFGSSHNLTIDSRVASTLGNWHPATQLLSFATLLYSSYFSISAPLFSPETHLKAFADDHISFLMTSPSHLSQIISFPPFADFDLSALNRVLIVHSENEKYDATLIENAKHKFGPNVEFVFALNGGETFGPFLSLSTKPTSIGKTLPNSETKIVDQNNKIVPIGSAGRLLTKGAHVMKGYYNKNTPETVISKDGWLSTPYTATADEEGNFYLV